MHKKIKAFTIIELIVVMAISSLVIIITLMVFLILQNQFTNYQRSSDSINRYYFFFKTIEGDLEKSIVSANSINELMIQKGEREIKYSFGDNLITREEQLNIDTLIKDIPEIKAEFKELFQNEEQLLLTFYLEEDTVFYNISYKTSWMEISE